MRAPQQNKQGWVILKVRVRGAEKALPARLKAAEKVLLIYRDVITESLPLLDQHTQLNVPGWWTEL